MLSLLLTVAAAANEIWKDASRHARRTHWAVDAALCEPPGRERAQRYVEDFQREFPGHAPFWAN